MSSAVCSVGRLVSEYRKPLFSDHTSGRAAADPRGRVFAVAAVQPVAVFAMIFDRGDR